MKDNKIPSNNGEDYTGRKINNWTVLGACGNTGYPKYHQIWMCECSCGTRTGVDKQNVLYGRSKGCQKCVGARHKKTDNPNWRGFDNIPSAFFTQLKHGAKTRGIKVQITIEDVNTSWVRSAKVCALTGLFISLGMDASLDRIDSSRPYTTDNIQWVHKDIQLMKNRFSQIRFVELCRLVSANSSKIQY